MYGDRPKFDEKDQQLVNEREARFNERTGPRVGDWLIMPEGHYVRFTHDWGDDIQTTMFRDGATWDASFYMGSGGGVSFSGSLDSALLKAKLVLTDEMKDGGFWMFHHNFLGAHRGVGFKIPCRVYRYVP